MNMNEAIADARLRIEALDLSDDNARVMAIDHQLAQIEQARNVAIARREEVLILLRPFREHEGSIPLPEGAGGSVANALLAGVGPSEAAELLVDRAQLEHEREALNEGITELNRRDNALQGERRLLPPTVGRRIMAELQPLCDVIEAEAREAAQVIERSFAALSAISRAARTNPTAMHATADAVAGMRGGAGLLSAAGDVLDVPAGINEVLALLADKGPAYTGGKFTSVRVRDHDGLETARAYERAMGQARAFEQGRNSAPKTPEAIATTATQKKWWR
jgi:hypothetical protein